MSTPELKQFADLTYSDFERYPVWVGVHDMDYGKPWWPAAARGRSLGGGVGAIRPSELELGR